MKSNYAKTPQPSPNSKQRINYFIISGIAIFDILLILSKNEVVSSKVDKDVGFNSEQSDKAHIEDKMSETGQIPIRSVSYNKGGKMLQLIGYKNNKMTTEAENIMNIIYHSSLSFAFTVA